MRDPQRGKTVGAPATPLARQAAALLAREIPAELRSHYVGGSLAERVVAACAYGQEVDAEFREIAALAAEESGRASAAATTTALQTYHREWREVLAAIAAGGT